MEFEKTKTNQNGQKVIIIEYVQNTKPWTFFLICMFMKAMKIFLGII